MRGGDSATSLWCLSVLLEISRPRQCIISRFCRLKTCRDLDFFGADTEMLTTRVMLVNDNENIAHHRQDHQVMLHTESYCELVFRKLGNPNIEPTSTKILITRTTQTSYPSLLKLSCWHGHSPCACIAFAFRVFVDAVPRVGDSPAIAVVVAIAVAVPLEEEQK